MGVGGGLVEGLVGVEVEEDGEEVGREFGGDSAELEIVSVGLFEGEWEYLRLRRWSGDLVVPPRRSR